MLVVCPLAVLNHNRYGVIFHSTYSTLLLTSYSDYHTSPLIPLQVD